MKHRKEAEEAGKARAEKENGPSNGTENGDVNETEAGALPDGVGQVGVQEASKMSTKGLGKNEAEETIVLASGAEAVQSWVDSSA